LTAGLSYSSVFWEKPVVLTSDFQQPNDGARVFGFGFEMAALKFLFLRAGYTTFGDLGSGLRIGGGLRFNILQVDYSFSGGGDFGNAHRIGIVLHFGEPAPNPERLAQRWYERGEKDFKKGHYTDAIVEFNKALEIDPQHPHAYDMMQKTYENLKASTPH
jgi:tetratricopeptide (TPR) repeat protein